MPIGDDYVQLGSYLRREDQPKIEMTFREVEAVFGFTLPPSARKHSTWWSNSYQAYSWLNVGYKTLTPNVKKRK